MTEQSKKSFGENEKLILKIIKGAGITNPSQITALTKLNEKKILRTIKSINKKSPGLITLDKDKKITSNIETLDSIVKDMRGKEGNRIVFRGLYISDPGIGTKAYDPRILKGLTTWMIVNGYNKNLTTMIMQGGLIPRIPIFRTDNTKYNMRHLGMDPEKIPDKNAIILSKDLEGDPYEARTYEKEIKKKLVNRLEAALYAKREMQQLLETIKVRMHYQWSPEDYDNVSDIEKEVYIEAQEKTKILNRINRKYGKQQENLNELQETLGELTGLRVDLKDIYQQVKGLDETKFNEKIEELIEKQKAKIKRKTEEDIDKISKLEETAEELDLLALEGKKEKMRKRLETRIRELDNVERKTLYQLKKMVNDTEHGLPYDIKRIFEAIKHLKYDIRLTAREMKLSEEDINSFLTSIGTRIKATPDQEMAVYAKSKGEYIYKNLNVALCHELVGKKILFPSIPHSHRIKYLTVTDKTSKANDIDTIYDIEFEAELFDKKGMKILLIGKPNFRSNNQPVNDDTLTEQKREIMFLNQLAHSGYREFDGEEIIPDVIISYYKMQGGFRAEMEMKKRENIVRGEVRETPKICTMFKLPSLQSLPALKDELARGIKIWDTKGFDSKLVASGAVFHTIYQDGTNSIEYVDSSQLIEVDKLNGEIGIYRKALDEEKDLKKRIELNKSISDLEERICVTERAKRYKIEVSGDSEIGKENDPFGRPSNMDFLEAGILYQIKNGLPNLLISSEQIHGPIPAIGYKLENFWNSKTPKEQEEAVEKIINDSKLTWEQKCYFLKKDFVGFMAGIPIPQQNTREEEAKRRIHPYFTSILDKGGKIAYPSGNHGAHSRTQDEASEVASWFDLKYLNKQFIRLDGKGSSTGMGAFRLEELGNKVIFAAHKLWKVKDVTQGAMRQLQQAGVLCDIAYFFHHHRPALGYANGIFFLTPPGKEGHVQYVIEAGMTSSLRGITNHYTDPESSKLGGHLGYHRVDFILDPTLEREEYMKGRWLYTLPKHLRNNGSK